MSSVLYLPEEHRSRDCPVCCGNCILVADCSQNTCTWEKVKVLLHIYWIPWKWALR